MKEVFRLRRIGDVENRGAVEFLLARQRIDRPRNRVRAAMMADVGDPSIALTMDRRLVRAAALQFIEADEAHIQCLRRRADGLPLRDWRWIGGLHSRGSIDHRRVAGCLAQDDSDHR